MSSDRDFDSSHDKRKKYRHVFSTEEDSILQQCVLKYGTHNWDLISQHLPNRNGRQCKERWCTYLSPEVNRTPWSSEEDALLYDLVQKYGKKWGILMTFFHNRTTNNVKNRWNTIMRKSQMIGIDQINKKNFMETGKKIVSRCTRTTFQKEKSSKAVENNPQELFSLRNLLNLVPV